jgi:mRNA-degrading endonuclease RelE of RelBE toxin-antitoxin system
MKHSATKRFWKAYDDLAPEICKLADKNFKLLKKNPKHPSLHFKKINGFWSARVGLFYRALGIDVPEDNTVVWFWIGTHDEYEKLINNDPPNSK